MPDNLFKPQLSTQTLPFHEIVSTATKAPYFSTTAYDYCKVFCDLELGLHMKKAQKHNVFGRFVLVQPFLRGNNLVVRRKAKGRQPAGPWQFSFGDCCGSAPPAWPAQTIVLKGTDGTEYLEFIPDFEVEQVSWLIVFNFADFEGCCV